MSREKSTEEQNVKIDAIVGDEALGYDRAAQGEHSGQAGDGKNGGNATDGGLADSLADNRPDQVK